MYQININRRNLRSALLLGAASAAAIGLVLPASAQDEQTETVIVTGSRIPQQGLYSASPVTAVGSQEMKFEDTTNVENLLDNLPSVTAEYGSTDSNGATGTATVNLRALGSKRTLVLVDGTRLMPGDPSDPVPDLNQVPAALVDHVEVLTGGASAVYGADAVAGVVNFIMRKDFEGVELDGGYSVNQHTNDDGYLRSVEAQGEGFTNAINPVQLAPSNVLDGATTKGTLLVGVNSDNGKGNITAYAGYQKTDGVLQSQRDISACGLGVIITASHEPTGLGAGPGLECMGSINAGPQYTSLVPFTGANAFLQYPYDLFTPTGTGTLTQLVNLNVNAYTFNYAPYNYMQRPDTRYTAGFFGHYEINKQLDFYTSFMFMDDVTDAVIAPSGAFFGHEFTVDCANPFLGSHTNVDSPYSIFGCTSPSDTVPFLAGAREPLVGSRDDHLEHLSYRFVEGAKGDLGDGWAYDVYGQYGVTIFQEQYLNDTSINKIQNALDVNPDGNCVSYDNGTDPTCVALDIFSGAGASQAAANYIRATGFQEAHVIEQILSASLTGDLGKWGGQSPWAKSPLAVALGVEYRQETLNLQTDEEFASGDLSGQGGQHKSVDGSFSVAEAYSELRIPLVQEKKFFEDLTLDGAYRYSSYSEAGATSTYKVGAEWQPIDDFRLRASQNHAVRAPNILELYTPSELQLWSGQDPCAGASPTPTLQQCERTGVTMGEYGHIIPCPVAQCEADVGGNPNLKPEVSDTRTVGIVLTPTFFNGFTATIDYFAIKVAGAIGTIPETQIINNCLNTGASYFCNQIQRGPGGILFGDQSYVQNFTLNTGSLSTQGVDFEANYTTELGDLPLPHGWNLARFGSIAVNFIGTQTEILDTQPYGPLPGGIPASATYNCAGEYGVVCGVPVPHWRHKMRFTWDSPWDVSVSFQWRHIGDAKFDGNNTTNPILSTTVNCGGVPCYDVQDGLIKDWDYFDLAANWEIREGVELTAGVNNIFDRNPPVIDSANIGISAPPFGNANTYPQVYDSLGRLLFINATIKY